jgi:hypothetical protein
VDEKGRHQLSPITFNKIVDDVFGKQFATSFEPFL